MIFGTADRPNINKRPGVKFGENSLNYLDLWHFSPPYQFLRINFRKLPDTYCICVSCVTLPGWDPCPCRIIFYYRYPIWIFPN